MYDYQDFTYDNRSGKFDTLPDFVKNLTIMNMHFIPILDIGIAKRPAGEYPAYDQGIAAGAFLQIHDNSEAFVGQVWPGDAVFPDFFKPAAVQWWQDQLDSFYAQIPFDGLWEDMNEVSNFCNGACYSQQKKSNSTMLNLPYLPTGRDLNIKSIDIDSVHGVGKGE
jgi:alpha-glucosidase (family GH31 glycosyl hydrolase)